MLKQIAVLILCVVDVNECSTDSSICTHGICENFMGGYQCRCLDGYQPNAEHTACIGR